MIGKFFHAHGGRFADAAAALGDAASHWALFGGGADGTDGEAVEAVAVEPGV